MPHDEEDFLAEVDAALEGPDALAAVLRMTQERLGAESGTIHLLAADGTLRLAAHAQGLPEPVLAAIRAIPVGKGMAGLAVERREPVTACNLQTDRTGDVRPGALRTGLRGAIVVPILRGEEPVGALGVANQAERTFRPDETRLLLEIGRRIARARP